MVDVKDDKNKVEDFWKKNKKLKKEKIYQKRLLKTKKKTHLKAKKANNNKETGNNKNADNYKDNSFFAPVIAISLNLFISITTSLRFPTSVAASFGFLTSDSVIFSFANTTSISVLVYLFLSSFSIQSSLFVFSAHHTTLTFLSLIRVFRFTLL